VSEVLAEGAEAKLKRIGVPDTFARSARDYKQLYEKYGMSESAIVNAALELMN